MTGRRAPPSRAWKPGQSGNPKGKAPGTRSRATLLAQALLEKDLEKVVSKVVQAALGGDMTAAKIILERLIPPVRERPVTLPLKADTTTAAGINQAAGEVLAAACDGNLLPSEAATLASIVETRRRTLELEELERRIAALEAKK